MAHQFRQAIRQLMDQIDEFRGAEAAGDLEPRESVGGAAVMLLENAVEPAAHQSERVAGGGEDAVAVRLDNAFVDVRREAEIVRVHHQLFACYQNSLSWMVRNFLGFARMSFISDCISRVAPLSVS